MKILNINNPNSKISPSMTVNRVPSTVYRVPFIWIEVILLSLILFSCDKPETKLANDTRPTVSAKLVKAGEAANENYFTVSGKIQAENYVDVSSRMMGYLTGIYAKVGDKVQTGQTLATIENTDIQNKIAQIDAGILEAETGLANIEKDYVRIKSLFEKQSATQKELDDIITHRDVMKAKIKQAQETKNEVNTMLSYTKIKAPFTGVIIEKYVHGGDLVSPGKPLFSVESGNNFQAAAMIPESQITNIAKGDRVKVIIKSSGQEINGTISEYSHSAINTGGQYLTKINLAKKEIRNTKLFSGMYVTVLLPNKKKAATIEKITVHKNAIVRQGQLTGLYTVNDNNTALLRWVRLGKSFGDQIEILSGLAADENYLTDYDGSMRNGVKVELK